METRNDLDYANSQLNENELENVKNILLDETDIEFFKNYSNYIIENYPFVDDEARHYAEKKEINKPLNDS
mgnify:CR=1 FL=1